MKKLFVLGGAFIGGVFGFAAFVQNALVNRNFRLPESFEKIISETGDVDEEIETLAETSKKWLYDWGVENHYITNADGNKLKGYLIRPKKESDIYVFASHGYHSEGVGEWCRIAPFYVEEMGYNMFFVDHQAHGESEGSTIGFGSFESRDALQWLNYLNSTFGSDIKIILHGISMGSATVMLMTGNDALPSNVRFTIADCGYTSARGEFEYKLDSLNIPKAPLIPLACAINKYKAGYDFQKDTDALAAVKRAKAPIFFVHGGDDKFVPTYMGYVLYHECTSEKDLLIVEGADHGVSYYKGTAQYQQKIKEFAEKYL